MILLADLTSFGESVLVPIVAIFCALGLPVLAFVIFRILRHRERMEMIRNGIAPVGPFRGRRDVASAEPTYGNEAAQTTLRKGIMLTFIGIALTLGISFKGYENIVDPQLGLPPEYAWHPGVWLLAGLIPLFVGLAQVVVALLSGADLRPHGMPPPPHVVETSEPPAPGHVPGRRSLHVSSGIDPRTSPATAPRTARLASRSAKKRAVREDDPSIRDDDI